MSLFTVVGDPHAKNSNLSLIQELFSMVEELGHPVIWLGDMLDTKEVIRGKALNAWWTYFATSKLQHTVLVGNHDWFNLDCDDHSLQVFKTLKNVTIVDSPLLDSAHNICYLPYIHEPHNLKEEFRKLPDGSTLFAHLEMKGFDYGTGLICKEGLVSTDLTKFSRVISGHFHKYQAQSNIVYLGTPFSHSFGESNQEKYIAIFDSSKNTFDLIQTPFRHHLTSEINCDQFNGLIPELFIETPGDPEFKGHLYRIILTGSKVNTKTVLSALREKHVSTNVKWLLRPKTEFDTSHNIDDTLTNDAQFCKWAETVKKMDPETLKLGLQILEACK